MGWRRWGGRGAGTTPAESNLTGGNFTWALAEGVDSPLRNSRGRSGARGDRGGDGVRRSRRGGGGVDSGGMGEESTAALP